MTPADLAAIEARCDAATPLPWEKLPLSMPREALLRIGEVTSFGTRQVQMCEEDATFIAHARSDVPALLAEVRRLQGECDMIKRWADTTLGYADERIAKLRLGLEQIASCKVVSVDPPDCPQIARNLLAGREWSDNGTTAPMARKGKANEL